MHSHSLKCNPFDVPNRQHHQGRGATYPVAPVAPVTPVGPVEPWSSTSPMDGARRLRYTIREVHIDCSTKGNLARPSEHQG